MSLQFLAICNALMAYQQGLITEDEYNERLADILDSSKATFH